MPTGTQCQHTLLAVSHTPSLLYTAPAFLPVSKPLNLALAERGGAVLERERAGLPASDLQAVCWRCEAEGHASYYCEASTVRLIVYIQD